MDIVIGTHSLASPGGIETYTVTVADHLQRLGHDVWVHAAIDGSAGDVARSLGLRVETTLEELPRETDALLVQDAATAYELAADYPLTPQVFVAHGDRFELAQPPGVNGVVSTVVTLYDRVERRVRARSSAYPIVSLRQPIDIDRFVPLAPLRRRPQVALTLGNYMRGERLAMLSRACARAGIELVHIGGHAGNVVDDPRPAINEADIVFGKARVILEAMACGRAAYVFDHNGGEGWVTAANQAQLAADNFGGQRAPIAIDEQRLVDDLARYDPEMGLVNRDYVVSHHSAHEHAVALVGVLRDVAPRPAPVDAPLRELARMARSNHRADVEAFLRAAELERAGVRIHGLEAELAQLRQTRRWRAAQALLAPVDRLRGRR